MRRWSAVLSGRQRRRPGGYRQKGNLPVTGRVVSIFATTEYPGMFATGEDGARDVSPRLSKAPLKSFPPPSARQAPASLPAGCGEHRHQGRSMLVAVPSTPSLRASPTGRPAHRGRQNPAHCPAAKRRSGIPVPARAQTGRLSARDYLCPKPRMPARERPRQPAAPARMTHLRMIRKAPILMALTTGKASRVPAREKGSAQRP